MSAIVISADEIGAILGCDFEVPAATFESVWETMRIERVNRKESEFFPDGWLEVCGRFVAAYPLKQKGCIFVAAVV